MCCWTYASVFIQISGNGYLLFSQWCISWTHYDSVECGERHALRADNTKVGLLSYITRINKMSSDAAPITVYGWCVPPLLIRARRHSQIDTIQSTKLNRSLQPPVKPCIFTHEPTLVRMGSPICIDTLETLRIW